MKLQPNPNNCELLALEVGNLPTLRTVPIGTVQRWIAPIPFGLGQYYFVLTKSNKVDNPFLVEGNYITGGKHGFYQWMDKWLKVNSRFCLYYVYDDEFLINQDPKVIDIIKASPNVYISISKFHFLLNLYSHRSNYNASLNYSFINRIKGYTIEILPLKYYDGEFFKLILESSTGTFTEELYHRSLLLNAKCTIYDLAIIAIDKLEKEKGITRIKTNKSIQLQLL